MPMIDMPVHELEQYNGTNPKPVDFDEYWEKALSEMRAVDSQVTTTKAEFQIPGVDILLPELKQTCYFLQDLWTISVRRPRSMLLTIK